MRIRIYYHAFATEDSNWAYIFLDQFKMLQDHGLLGAADCVHITALGNPIQRQLLKQLAATFSKTHVHELDSAVSMKDIASDFASLDESKAQKFLTEAVTLNKLWRDSQHDDFYLLYLHTKGVSSLVRNFGQGDVITFKNVYYWRKYLDWGVIESWRECVGGLEQGCHMAGCNFNSDPFAHFSGNFWWARSDYIRLLDDNTNSQWWQQNRRPYHTDRLCDEMWPGSLAENIYTVHQPELSLCSPNPGLYSTAYERKNYDKLS